MAVALNLLRWFSRYIKLSGSAVFLLSTYCHCIVIDVSIREAQYTKSNAFLHPMEQFRELQSPLKKEFAMARLYTSARRFAIRPCHLLAPYLLLGVLPLASVAQQPARASQKLLRGYRIAGTPIASSPQTSRSSRH